MTIDMKSLELAMAKLNKSFGANTVIRGNAVPVDVDVYSTGNFMLDLATGVGGLPKGRIIEIYGPEAIGKSLLSMGAVASCQERGDLALYVDAECGLDPVWCTKNGMRMDDLILNQPSTGEEGLQVAIDLMETGALGLIVIDSVAALTPKSELEGDMDDQQVGAQARILSKALRKMTHTAMETNTCVVFINQLRDKIGFMANGGTTTPGGRALKFYASMRIELKRMGNITDKKTNEIIGTRVKAFTQKNRVASPMKYTEYDVLHGKGFNNFGSVLEQGIRFKYIEQRGAYYYKEGAEKAFAQGEANAVEALASDLDWYRELQDKIKANL